MMKNENVESKKVKGLIDEKEASQNYEKIKKDENDIEDEGLIDEKKEARQSDGSDENDEKNDEKIMNDEKMIKTIEDENVKCDVKKIKSMKQEVKIKEAKNEGQTPKSKLKEVKIDDQTPKSKFRSVKLMFEKNIRKEARNDANIDISFQKIGPHGKLEEKIERDVTPMPSSVKKLNKSAAMRAFRGQFLSESRLIRTFLNDDGQEMPNGKRKMNFNANENGKNIELFGHFSPKKIPKLTIKNKFSSSRLGIDPGEGTSNGQPDSIEVESAGQTSN